MQPDTTPHAYITFDGLVLDASNGGAGTLGAREINGAVRPEYPSHHITIKNSVMKGAIFNGLAVFGSFNTFTDIELAYNGFDAISPCPGGCWGYGAYVGGGDNLFQRIRSHHNASYGFHVYGSSGLANNNRILDSEFDQNCLETNEAEVLLGGTNTLFANNLVHNSGRDVLGFKGDCSSNTCGGDGIRVRYSAPVNTRFTTMRFTRIGDTGFITGSATVRPPGRRSSITSSG